MLRTDVRRGWLGTLHTWQPKTSSRPLGASVAADTSVSLPLITQAGPHRQRCPGESQKQKITQKWPASQWSKCVVILMCALKHASVFQSNYNACVQSQGVTINKQWCCLYSALPFPTAVRCTWPPVCCFIDSVPHTAPFLGNLPFPTRGPSHHLLYCMHLCNTHRRTLGWYHIVCV